MSSRVPISSLGEFYFVGVDEAVGAVIRAAHALHMDEARPTVKHVAIGRARTLRLNITLGSRTMKAVHVR